MRNPLDSFRKFNALKSEAKIDFINSNKNTQDRYVFFMSIVVIIFNFEMTFLLLIQHKCNNFLNYIFFYLEYCLTKI